MSLLHDARAALGANPGVHALIIGVSEYPFLGGGAQAVADPWDLRQLTSTASSAHKVFEWITTARLSVPLATCRVLLSPSPAEPHLTGVAEPATFDNVLEEANAWRDDAGTNPANITFFYFAGHGVQRDKEDAVMCLHDFRQPPGSALRHAIDSTALRAGMSPSSNRPDIARTQFYFVDACRERPEQTAKFKDPKTGDLWDIELDGIDDRSSPVFFASLSNDKAQALPGAQTLFSRALLSCLEGDAADGRDDENGNPVWEVTVESLNRALRAKIDDVNREVGGAQDYTTAGQFKQATLCQLPAPPQVDVVLQIIPEAASQVGTLRVIGDDGIVVKEAKPPLVPYPVVDRLPAGFYSIELTFNPPAPPFVNRQRNQPARAPRAEWKVKVS
jgi:hypothetical protein